MGLDYSYMLYFKWDQLEEVLLGVSEFAEKHLPQTRIVFPNHVLEIPFDLDLSGDETFRYDDAEIGFTTALIFEEDEAILDWGHSQDVTDNNRPPPGKGLQFPVSVGCIYLTVYNDLSIYYPEIDLDLQDLVLFNFGTTGTRMSTLFYYSTSIRTQFVELLRKHRGVCGIFNMEEEGEVFWLNGAPVRMSIEDVWISPDEIRRRFAN